MLICIDQANQHLEVNTKGEAETQGTWPAKLLIIVKNWN